MLTDNQKQFVYENYLKIELNEIAEILDLPINHLDRFIAEHSVGEMIDKFDSLKKEGFEVDKLSNFEKWQIEKMEQKKEIFIERRNGVDFIVISSKLNDK